jgi:hypothetical protein
VGALVQHAEHPVTPVGLEVVDVGAGQLVDAQRVVQR